MTKNKIIHVKGTDIAVFQGSEDDYLSLTDIARFKDASNMDAIIQNWLRNRNTIELLGFWETMYNQNFKPLEFEGFRKKAGLNSFVMTPKKCIETTNAVLISQGLSQRDRLKQLNEIAIYQMKSLVANNQIKKLK